MATSRVLLSSNFTPNRKRFNTEDAEKSAQRARRIPSHGIRLVPDFSFCSVLLWLGFPPLRFEDDLGEGGVAVVRNGEGDVLHAEAVGDRARRSGKFQCGLAAWLAHDFDVTPADSLCPPCAEGLHGRFLGCEAAGEAFGAVAVLLAVGDFGRRE